ncbi:unnamed protein product [Phaedon cochleariae]|uniref:Peptidase S54 rhomboid domain-containing protein n=1 Tax=Phaedon cochleariae TaxID=80249 RepID=A0A9P0DL31_PHACE|nr:unnamed protein product [Phaedon cochleariae]
MTTGHQSYDGQQDDGHLSLIGSDVKNSNDKNKKCPMISFFMRGYIPIAIMAVSIIQICFHILLTQLPTLSLENYLKFQPGELIELWRLVTYMLLHDGWTNLILNVVFQCRFAILLEKRQGCLKVLGLYLIGGVAGAMGSFCFYDEDVVGASAGVMALVFSTIPDIVKSSEKIFDSCRGWSIGVLVLSDVVRNILEIYTNEVVTSWPTHIFGGFSGLLFGFKYFKSTCKIAKSSDSSDQNGMEMNERS